MNHPLSILVIEDDADTLANLCDILELDGHVVLGVNSLAETKRVTRDHQFQIAISDRKLPEGYIEDLLSDLKSSLKGADIIVITGFADMQSTITAFRLGVTDYVIKPIIPDDLRRTVQQIAEKRRLEDELAREHRFADLVLNTAEAIVLVLDLDGNVIQFNPYFEQLTGWTHDDLLGKDWFRNCIAEHEHERVKEVFIETAHCVKTRGVVNAVVGKNGDSYQIRWANTTLRDLDGEVTAVLAVGVDISDLTIAQERALQAERLAAIGQTMTALAHESRNALQRIQAATEMLGLEVENNPNALKDLKAIQRANEDLKSLLEEVRLFAAPIHIRRSPVRFPEIWRRVWNDLSPLHSKRDVELIESFEGCNVDVHVDAPRLEQVFRNLFENSLAACTDPVRIEINCICVDDRIELVLSDNGPGISQHHLEMLFQPFFTTKPTGTGLGLSICQRIVEAHQGTLVAKDASGGARFEIRLPRQNHSTIPCLS
ncbi:MAG: PAS domain S-box protein [Planctomycetales bacterium]|nr:PAS domain S-box protein [Planctomycetales bacterium]